ncbi:MULTISPECIES: YbaY family lipoprotein [unclassified Ruegeria]|uniref:YbaY family lipoprotein n=1 Tax=unclassified Ruegeria TaxID=2625375 RepID=UPI00148998ED|nr:MULTISPECIES: YbaY family lipoprotein [unclassified Ruegeria]NOD74656.1 META domain-containing protein [Ruegeria sp. HKCCD4332]NOD88610.1 META domain-containing protein [Ruegeria sp. HKCCD4318]NOE12162.1 META domain-containing protein [Ruegeria sp. HKCCD4318-2]NOG09673.1 META domain-containing protein [Ruegeria sp. HKCCD4315]
MLTTAQATLAGAAIATMISGAAMAGTVEGTATYRERLALPPDATLFVELQDISLADAPAVTLSAQRYALTGVPAQFELTYDDALIKEGHSYAVRATVTQGQKLLFTTDTVYPVLTNEAGNSADLLLVQIQSQKSATLENTEWVAATLNGAPLQAERRPELSFGQGGAFGGSGGCNRFSGQAEVSGNRISFPDNMAATLMACPPELDEVERAFLKSMQAITSFAMEGDALALLDAEGEPVIKLVRK